MSLARQDMKELFQNCNIINSFSFSLKRILIFTLQNALYLMVYFSYTEHNKRG